MTEEKTVIVSPDSTQKALKQLELCQNKLNDLFKISSKFKLYKSADNEYKINNSNVKLNTTVKYLQKKNELCIWYATGICPGDYKFVKDCYEISKWNELRKEWDTSYTTMKHQKFGNNNDNDSMLLTTQYTLGQFGVSSREFWCIQSSENLFYNKIYNVYATNIDVDKKYHTKGCVLGKILMTGSKFTELTDDEVKTLKLPTKIIKKKKSSTDDDNKESKSNDNNNNNDDDLEELKWTKFEVITQIDLKGWLPTRYHYIITIIILI